jgi:hypothetical protein
MDTQPCAAMRQSTLLEIIDAVAWRSSGPTVNVSAATLFRLVDEGCTFLADEMENLKDSDRRKFSDIIAIFNAGFCAGAAVPRMEKGTVRKFYVYGPKVIAGINTVTDTIWDRSFSIKMVRKAPQEQTERLNMRTEGNLFEPYRLSLELWAERNGPLVQDLYDTMDRETALQGCDDRFVDIAEPLIAVLKFADTKSKTRRSGITDEVMPLLKELGEQKTETEADESIAALCDLLDAILRGANQRDLFESAPSGPDQTFIYSEKLLYQIMQTPALRRITSTKSLAIFMSKFELNPRPDAAGKKRGYYVSKAIVVDIRLRYLSEASEASNASVTRSQ